VQVCISASDIIWIGTKVEEHIKFNWNIVKIYDVQGSEDISVSIVS
jgi:hypothetical protein